MEHTLDVEALKRRTQSHVFEQWRAYWKMKRWGEDWQQTAQLTAIHASGNKPLTDFMPKYVPPSGKAGREAVDRTTQILNAYLEVHQALQERNRGNR